MMKTQIIRTYSELMSIPTFKGRYEYLKIGDKIGDETFGFDRYLNQIFYKSKEWERIRNFVISRDNGCDLGHPDHEIRDELIIIHHLNPITIDDIKNRSDFLLNPEYLICTILNTHNAIHYGNSDLLYLDPVERYPNDTCPWKR